MQYFFILGRNPELSLAELRAVLPAGYRVLACSREALIVECTELEVERLMKRLGGTIKIGEILTPPLCHSESRLGGTKDLARMRGHAAEILQSLRSFRMTENCDRKFFLGLSAYALDDKAKLPTVRQLRELGMEFKRELQAQGRSVRLVTSKDIALSSVIVKKEKLLTQGAEIVLLYGASKPSNQSLTPNPYTLTPQFIGRTLAVQEFEQASARDYGRPARGMKVGMLPIQLAKIMINLARVPLRRGSSSGSPEVEPPYIPTILDPFCGFGTILSEALLMGYTHLIGSDLEQKMVNASKQNLRWVQTEFPISNFQFPKFFQSPVEKISAHIPAQSVDAIVTEPYLGPTRGIKNEELKIKNELTNLYVNSFREFSKILKPGGRVVFIMPAFRSRDGLIKTSATVLPKIKNLGFTPIPLLPQNSKFYILHSAFSITYSRPDQRVLREIFVLEFKK